MKKGSKLLTSVEAKVIAKSIIKRMAEHSKRAARKLGGKNCVY